MKAVYFIMIATIISATAIGQDKEKKDRPNPSDTTTGKKRYSISISHDGFKFNDESKPKTEKVFSMNYLMLDIGFNTLLDKTNYQSTAAQQFIQYNNIQGPASGKDIFSLRAGKSINVNIWPAIAKMRLLKTTGQKIYVSTGVGFQIYNFRYSKNITYRSEPKNMVVLDTINFSKNKVAINYLSIPLGFTFKTKLAEKAWLVYGFGLTGGYRIDSWTKQKSSERGKEKNHDKYNFSNFNGCITGEFGVDGYFRLYASYQLTPLHDNVLDQYPLCIGFRIGGV